MKELTYTRVGDYYIPDLKLAEQPDKPIGKYGRIEAAVFERTPPRLV